MPSRRDQIQSYQFAVQRVVSALVAREADPARSPLRRLVGAGFGSLMVAVIALAAVGVFGLLTGRSGSGWRDGGAVILEKETGAAYVYRDGRLIPTANFASALLLLGSTARTVTVPRSQLAGEPRGSLVGIENAPDALPDPARLLRGGWTLCNSTAPDSSGRSVRSTSMLIGAGPDRGRSLRDEAVIVKQTDNGALHLIWHNRRYRIQESAVVLEALALRQEPQIQVGTAWLNAIPAGQPIEPIEQSNRGRSFSRLKELPDVRVGQVLVVEAAGDARQFYLVGTERLRPITELQAAVLLATRETQSAYNGRPQARVISAAAAAAAPKSAAPAASGEQPPDRRPQMARPGGADATLCATFTGPDGPAEVIVDAEPIASDAGLPTAGVSGRGTSLVNRVVVESGGGAVVEAVSSPDAPAGTLVLVTDLGLRYAVPSRQVLQMLGYGAAQPVRLPASLVARLPEGPALDPAAATRPIGSN